jgi:hypothetical protein
MREATREALALLWHEAKEQSNTATSQAVPEKELKLSWCPREIIELEALCKRLREDAQKLKEDKTTLEGMIQSHDELIMEMAEEYGLNYMGENDNDEDDGDEGNTVAPPAPAAVPEEIIEEEAPMENGPQELDDLDDLDDDLNEAHSNMDEWFPQDGSNDWEWVIESKSLSLGLRISF